MIFTDIYRESLSVVHIYLHLNNEFLAVKQRCLF